jgi:hypothetical protein
MTIEGVFPAGNLPAMAGWIVRPRVIAWRCGSPARSFRWHSPPAPLRSSRGMRANQAAGFSSLAAVAELFSNHWLLLAGYSSPRVWA